MSARNLAFAIGLSLAAIAGPAGAQRLTAVPAPARFAFLDAPPPPPRPAAPEPAHESDEYPRHAWEASPDAAFDAPFCRGNALGPGHCKDTGNGYALGGTALYRLTPYIALGGTASFASFDAGTAAPGAFSRASFIGFVVRGYFADRGFVDPWVEAGFGRGSISTGSSDPAGDFRSDAAGPATAAGAGVDFWVAPYLKLGPALSYHWALLTDLHTCVGSSCQYQSISDLGAVGSYATLGLHVTVALGREM